MTRQHILDVATEMIDEGGSKNIHINNLAKRASVGVPTIYYHFTSRSQLIAEAQIANYETLLGPSRDVLAEISSALRDEDVSTYQRAIGNYLRTVSSSDQLEHKWNLVSLLLDVHDDEAAQECICKISDAFHEELVVAFERAQGLGWLSNGIDASVLVSLLWSASIGQVLVTVSPAATLTPEAVSYLFDAVATTGVPVSDNASNRLFTLDDVLLP